MAQYYHVTSLEELHKLYPNLQLDNLDGIQCTIQDDQVAQYTDDQGQKVITTIEQTGMQLSHDPGSSQHCTSQQPQFVLHQPAQYVIQQMDSSEPQTSAVQYIQQRQQPTPLAESEIPIIHFKDQSVGSLGKESGNEEHSLQRHIIEQEGSQQYLPQVQPVLQEPIQISQQIQAVRMGGNILVFQKQENQDLIMSPNKNQEMISSAPEKQQQSQHIYIQRPQQQKFQQISPQKQIIQKSENFEECTQQQILQNKHLPQVGGQKQQIIHQTQQQNIQPIQYFNQVTVIDGFSPPRITIEHRPPSTENILQQQSQTHQFRSKKDLQQAGLPTIIQQSQVLVPQKFELPSSPPVGSNLPQNKKKVSQPGVEGTTAQVFIVQEVDSPFLIRQHQGKIRFQGPSSSSEKSNENSYQTNSAPCEQIAEKVTHENRKIPQLTSSIIQQVETQPKMHTAGQTLQSAPNKCSPVRSPGFSQVKVGIVEQPFEIKSPEQMNRLKVGSSLSAKPLLGKMRTIEQQTETTGGCSGKEGNAPQGQRFVNSPESQVRPLFGFSSQVQSPGDIQNQVQIPSRGRGIRGPSPRGYQFVPKTRGVQVQTSPPRRCNIERTVGISEKVKSRGGGKFGRSNWASTGSEQRQLPLIRTGVQQAAQSSASKSETNQVSSDIVEEARMVVLLINGEKKIFKIPCSQNIVLGQILQQAGLSLSPLTPFTVEQVMDSNNADFRVLKANPSQQLSIGAKPSNVTQVVSVPNSPGSPRNVLTTIQQRPRGPFIPQASNVSIVKQRFHLNSSRMPTSGFSGSPTVTSNTISESTATPSQNSQSTPLTATAIKEEPRFVSGFMAICPFCGISSLDFNKCIRCRRKLPENVKSQSIFSVKKKKDKASGSSEKIEESKSDTDEKQSDSGGSEGKEKNCTLQQVCDKRKPKACLKKKKISDEPTEILILSSDEEEESKNKKAGPNAPALPMLKKEPVYSDTLNEREIINSLKENNLSEDLLKIEQPGSFTTLQCRTIRIGSYKVQPKDRIFLSSRGIRMVVNSLKNEIATIIIPTSDVLKVLFHYGRQIPVLFIYPLPKIGYHIRESLGMNNKMGPYYDPTSTQEETHKRITVLLEKITEDNKVAINKIFSQDKLEELSEKEANEILVRASPIEAQHTCSGKPTDTVKKIMVYPPPPEKGGITLNNQDYACLGEDQFLNDVIIDFYLKYLMLKVLSPADRNRTHVFSTFFYKRLTTKPKTLRRNDPENDPKLSPAEKRHTRVKGWTKQVNLFEKDFIIVPINEHSHWFLAIICFPGLTGPVRFSDNTPVEPEEVNPKKNAQTVQIGNTTITHIIKTDGNTVSLEMDSGSDRDEAEGDQDDLHPSSDDEGNEQVDDESVNPPHVQIPLLAPTSEPQASVKDLKTKIVKRKLYKEPIKQPCILIFDSLAGASRVRVVATLRDYLKIEYKKKMGQDRDFSKDTIKGAVPKVPQQNNFTDCGLYVLQYVESFFQDPLHDFKLPLKYLQDWFPEEVVSSKRQKLASLIRNLMEEQGIKVEEMGLPVLTFTNGNNTGEEQTRIEDEEVEDEDELNEEEEEILRSRVQVSEFENEDEDLNVEEEDEMEEEEEDEDEDEELEEEEDDLEMGEIPKEWITRASGSCSELEPSVRCSRPTLFKTNDLVEYDPSDSDEDGHTLPHNFIVIKENQRTVSKDISKGREHCESDQSLVSENRKTVPLTEFQDFESQISCTTIERNLDGKSTESDMVISEGEEITEEQCRGAANEQKASFETSASGEADVMNDSFNQFLKEKTNKSNEVQVKDSKTVQVSDILKKLVNDKNITISRKEDELNSSIFRKHLDVKKFKVKDCDKKEAEQAASLNSSPNANLGSFKRSYQALKSVRIQKKTERNLELCSKRQKIDER